MTKAKDITKNDLAAFSQGGEFWTFVRRGGEHDCWPWLGGKTAKGYGRLEKSTVEFRAHRVAFALARETPLPGVVMVCHDCDNPPCCNPAHLFLGVAKDNAADAVSKGRLRTPRARSNGNGKLSDAEVQAIRASPAPGTETAKRYGVSPALVSMIRRGSRR